MFILATVIASLLPTALPAAPQRARDLGVPFDGSPGKLNSITDVRGVEVGHCTIVTGDGDLEIGKGPIRTGVTAVLPTGKTYRPVFAAWSSLNGNGEMTGTHWIEESGMLEEPILLTNTHSVGIAHDAAIRWRRESGFHHPDAGYGWASLPVVAETWDGRLNDIHGHHVQMAHVFSALNTTSGGQVAEGNVGGGTGMVCFRFKSGIGTASRITTEGYTLGVLVQANFGLREQLTIAGVPVGRSITDLEPEMHSLSPGGSGNSIIVIVATDAPLLPHQLKRVAKRVPMGIARTGGLGYNSSGDLFLAFSTFDHGAPGPHGIRNLKALANDQIDPFFKAVAEATEESIINALVAAETMSGINGNKVHAMPHDRLREILKQYNRLVPSDGD